MDNALGEITYIQPNALGDFFASPGGGGTTIVSSVSTLYTLNQVGDLIELEPNAGIVNVATTTTVANNTYNLTGITYNSLVDETTISNNVQIPHQNSFAHNPENNYTFPDHIINANVKIGEASLIPGRNPDVTIYPTSFSVGDVINVARSINLHSGALGTTITSVQGVSIDATIDVNVNSGGACAIDSGGATTINAGGVVTIDAVGDVSINGAVVNINGGDVITNTTNKQDNIAGDNNLACGAFTAETGAMNLTTGLLACESAGFDIVSLAGFGVQSAGPISFATATSFSVGSQGAITLGGTSVSASNVFVSSINGFPYIPGGGGSNASLWSIYPAQSTINANGYDLSNANYVYGTNAQFTSAFTGQIFTTALTTYSETNISSIITNSISTATISTNSIKSNLITGNAILGNSAIISSLNTSTFVTASVLTQTINGVPVSGYNNSNWSLLPAISSINMNGYNLLNLGVLYGNALNANYVNTSNVTCSNAIAGSTLTISTINGSPYTPATVPSNWSAYPALQNVNMGGFGFSSVCTTSYWFNDPLITNNLDQLFTESIGSDQLAVSALLQTVTGCRVNLNGYCTANDYSINPTFVQYDNAVNPTIVNMSSATNLSAYWFRPTGSDYDININFPLNGDCEYGTYTFINGLNTGGNNMWINIRIYANTLSGTLLQYDRFQLNPGQSVQLETYPYGGGTQATWRTYKTVNVGSSGLGG